MEEEQLSSILTGFLRTFVPTLVGAVATWLATMGILVEPTAQNALVSGIILFLASALTSGYYLLVRSLAQKWPVLEILLGSKQTPTYKG